MKSPVANATLRIVLPYLFFAGLWIVFSDRVLDRLVADPGVHARWSLYKGWAFVLVTALLLASLLRREFRRRERTDADLLRANRALRTISECNQLLVRATDERALLDGLCRLLVDTGGYRMAWVGFAEQNEAKTVRPIAQAGFESGYLDSVEITWADTERGRGPTGTAIRTGQSVIARDIPTDPAYAPWRAAAIQRGYASSIALPLAGEGRAVGVLSVYAAEADAFDAPEEALLTELADDLAYGLVALRTRAEHERMEAVLHEQQQFLTSLLDNISEAVVSCDAQGRLTRFNRAARDLHGLPEQPIPPEQWAGHYALFEADGQTPLRKERIPLFRALQGETVRDTEMVVAPTQGRPHSLIASAQPLRDAAGGITGAVASMHDITERKQAEAALCESENRFRQLFAASPDALFLLDRSGRFLDCNDMAVQRYGYSRLELLQMTAWELAAPSLRDQAAAQVKHALETGGAFEWRHRCKDGTELPVEISAKPLALGRQTFVLSSVRDITERKQAERALRQERDFSAAILDTLPGVFYCYDENRTFRRWNKNFERVTGYTGEEIARMSPLDFFAGTEKELLAQRIQEVFNQGMAEVEADFVSKDGTHTPYYFTGLTTMLEGQRHLVGVGIDISARHASEAELRTSEARFRSLVETASTIILLISPEGRILEFNPAAERLYGCRRASVVGEDYLELFIPACERAAVRTDIGKVLSGTPTRDFENSVQAADGVKHVLSWNVDRVLGPHGTAMGVIAIGSDITARQQAEQERQKFFMLAESSSEFIGMCDLDLKPLYVNPAGVRMVGLPDMATACRVKVQDYFFPEDQRFIAEEFFPRVLREGHGDVEIRLRHFQTGEPIWMFYYLFSVRDASGTPVGWATVSRDITERKRAEAALRASEERMSFALHQSHTGGWELDLVDHTAHRTLEHDRIFGYDALLPQWTYEMFLEHVLPEDRAEVDRRFQAAVAAKADWSFECRIRRVDGVLRWIWASGNHQRDTDGTLRRLAGIVQDITERKEAEAALLESEERLRLALDAAHMGTFDWNVPANRIVWSHWHEELWGFQPGEFAGTYEAFSSRVHPDDLPGVNAEVARCIAARAPFAHEFRVIWPDASTHWILATGEFTFDAAGQAARMRGTVKEITDRKRVEEDLRQSEAAVRSKLKAIVEPEGDLSTLSLSDIVDPQLLQSLLEEFYRATGMLGAILDVSGKVLVAVGWQDICTQFHRCHPETLKNCIESDTLLTTGVPAGTTKAYHCTNRMWDMVTPLIIGGRHVGNVFVGQFFYADETPDVELFREQARRYGFDETEYLAALGRVPRFSRETAEAGMQFYAKLAGVISKLSYSAIQQSRMLAERQRAEVALGQSREQLRALSARLETLREEERTRISREIHDELGQMLTALKMDLRWIEHRLDDFGDDRRMNPVLDKLVATGELADATVKTVQRIAAELRPGILDKLGLGTALQYEAAQFQERSGIPCSVRLPESEPSLLPEAATAFFRIFQEALTNVARHAHATAVEVRLLSDADDCRLEIRDNGRGLTGVDLANPESLGLLGMQERARLLGGEVRFTARSGGGTVVTVRIPNRSTSETCV